MCPVDRRGVCVWVSWVSWVDGVHSFVWPNVYGLIAHHLPASHSQTLPSLGLQWPCKCCYYTHTVHTMHVLCLLPHQLPLIFVPSSAWKTTAPSGALCPSNSFNSLFMTVGEVWPGFNAWIFELWWIRSPLIVIKSMVAGGSRLGAVTVSNSVHSIKRACFFELIVGLHTTLLDSDAANS